jgi:hypothetical protein
VWGHVPLADQMRFYRLAQDQVWQWLFARITAASPDAVDLATALDLTARWLFAFVDRAMTRANQAYEEEREAWLRGAAAARAVAIEDIVADREHDGQAASKRLRYDVSRHHIGLILWVDHVPDNGDALSLLSAAVSDVARFVAAEHSITHPTGSLALAAWLSGRRAFPMNAMDVVGDGAPGSYVFLRASGSRWANRATASKVFAVPTSKPAMREEWHHWSPLKGGH